MGRIRISMSDIVMAQPLVCDLYASAQAPENERPLLRQGQILHPGTLLDTLIHKGLYAEADALALQAPPSALRTLNQLSHQLDRLLHAMASSTSAQDDVRQLAREAIKLAGSRRDIALASVLLGQIAGPYAVRHCLETALVAATVAAAMRRPFDEALCVVCAALTMNVGMLGYHEQYQHRRGGLSDEETRTIQRHPMESAALLAQAGVSDADWLTCVEQHHETPDGRGYPQGCTGIAPNAQLLSLADRYCAAVSARNYRRSQLPDAALRELLASGVEPALAEAFEAALGACPPGTRVRLHSGETGVVASDDAVAVLLDADGDAYAEIGRAPAGAIREALHEDQAGLRFSMKQIWGDQAGL
ncbi:MAG TPA: HD domain-containing phosphohydrolase [Burkholderiaceae bacterium]